jgi:hypothetical protein
VIASGNYFRVWYITVSGVMVTNELQFVTRGREGETRERERERERGESLKTCHLSPDLTVSRK